MKPVRLPALFLLGAAFLPWTGRAAENVGLPEQLYPQLDSILRSALQQSPSAIQQNLALLAARGDEIQAKAGQYPSVGGSVSYSESSELRQGIAGAFNTQILNYSMSLTQPIWHWGTVRNTARIGEIQRKMAEQQYQDAYRLFAQEIRTAYLGLIVTKANLEYTRFSQRIADDSLKLAEDRLAKGAISAGEIVQPRIAADAARLATDRAAEELDYGRRTFGALTGAPPPAVDDLPADIPALNGDEATLARLLGGFLSQKDPQNSATIQAHQQLEVARLNLANVKKRLYPMFNFTAGISQNRQSYSLDVGQLYRVEDRYVGVTANWSIFDGLATHGAIKSSRARMEQAEAAYRKLTAGLARDAQHAEKLTEFALRQMRLDDRTFDERGSFLQGSEADFKRGTISQANLDAVRQAFYGAEIAAFNSRAAYLHQLGDFLGLIMDDPVLGQIKAGGHE